MENKVFTRDELRSIVRPLLQKHRLAGAYLFGSYARQEARPESDIDVLIQGGPTLRALSLYALGDDLRELTGKNVDVFEISELESGSFKEQVLREAVEL